jgi:hypothetical protein
MAAILGIAAASLSVHIIVSWANPPQPEMSVEMYRTALPWRMAVAALVALIDFAIGTRWLNERRSRSSGSPRSSIRTAAVAQPTVFSARLSGSGDVGILGRLAWQHWRQSISTIVVISVVLLLLAMFPTGGLVLSGWLLPDWFHIFSKRLFIPALATIRPLFMLALATVPLLGLCAFLADQRGHSFRFLADRGVPPKYVWLSRQLVVLMSATVVLTGLLIVAFRVAPPYWSARLQEFDSYAAESMLFVFGAVILGIAAGQLCAMFFRSGILAGVFSLLLTAVLFAWLSLMLFWHVNFLWSVLAIPLALLLATRLRTAHWLLERNSLRAWFFPSLVLVVSATAIVTAVPFYRIYQIPDVGPGFAVEDYERPMTAEEQATFDLYERATDSWFAGNANLHRSENDKNATGRTSAGLPERAEGIAAWLDAQSKTISLAMKASRGNLFDPMRRLPRRCELFDLSSLLVDSADKLTATGRLNDALEQYLAAIRIAAQYRDWCQIRSEAAWDLDNGNVLEREVYARLALWATRPHQTPERVLGAERRLRELASHMYPSGLIVARYLLLRRIINGDLTALGAIEGSEGRPLPMLMMLWLRLPWERDRALRLLNFETYCELRAAWGTASGQTVCRDPESYDDVRRTQIRLAQLRESELLYALCRQVGLPEISCEETDWDCHCYRLTLAEDAQATETVRRAGRLILALEAWKLRHGKLPRSLDELVGPCLDQLPCDPCSGMSFRYVPDGLAIPLRWNLPFDRWSADWHPPFHETKESARRGELSARMPFVWSTGIRVRVVHKATPPNSLREEYDIAVPGLCRSVPSSWRWADSDYDVWSSGWPFPIP